MTSRTLVSFGPSVVILLVARKEQLAQQYLKIIVKRRGPPTQVREVAIESAEDFGHNPYILYGHVPR